MKNVVLKLLLLLILSFDSKAQFTLIPTNTQDQLNRIIKVGTTTFVSTFYNYLLRSDDDFDTFSIIPLPTSFNYSTKILKYQHNKLYLLAGTLGPTFSEFWVSNDTGANWTLLHDTANVFVLDFTMFDTLNGVIYASQHRKFRTNDGGQNWVYEYTGMYVPGQIFMYDSTFGLVINGEKVIFSDDRFVTETVSSCSSISYTSAAQFLNKDTIVFCSCVNNTGCYFVITENMGLSWQSKNITEFEPSRLHFFNYNEGYVVGWGYILGVAPLQGVIRKTTDMGATWTTYLTGIDYKLNDIHFLNDSIALITGEQGILLKWNKHSTATAVIEMPNENGISLYPNPSTSEHILKIASTSKYNQELIVKMYDIFGRKVSEHRVLKNSSTGYELRNDISNLSKGVYLYKWRMSDREYFVKFVK